MVLKSGLRLCGWSGSVSWKCWCLFTANKLIKVEYSPPSEEELRRAPGELMSHQMNVARLMPEFAMSLFLRGVDVRLFLLLDLFNVDVNRTTPPPLQLNALNSRCSNMRAHHSVASLSKAPRWSASMHGCGFDGEGFLGTLLQNLLKYPEIESTRSRTAGAACSSRSWIKLLRSPMCPGIISCVKHVLMKRTVRKSIHITFVD